MLPPVEGQLVQRFAGAWQGGRRVGEEAMGAEDGREAASRPGDGQGLDAGSQGIAHRKVLQHELSVAQLEARPQSRGVECMPSF